MTALRFTPQPTLTTVDPNRSDVACFVGFAARKDTPIPDAIAHFLQSQNLPITHNLLNVPVPIDSWSLFQQLFSTERPIANGTVLKATSYLSAAVRSFFAQGGRRCMFIRAGDPFPIEALRSERLAQINRLIPGFDQGVVSISPSDRSSWKTLGHLFALEEVSFLCFPDLCDLVATDPEENKNPPTVPNRSPEKFTTCSTPQSLTPNNLRLQALTAPRCDDEAYLSWARALNLVGEFLFRQTAALTLRPIQLVAAIPLPKADTPASANLLNYLESSPFPQVLTADLDTQTGLVNRNIQLTYPWVKTNNRLGLPEGLESPDGVLTGILSRNALTQGTYRSAAGVPPLEQVETDPTLGRSHLYQTGYQDKSFIERVSLFGPTPTGVQLLSDVTTSLSEPFRPASVHRLTGSIIRAARRLGQSHLFEPNGPHLWQQLTESLRTLMGQFYLQGALRGATEADGFEVRCDRTTMSQSDIDNGRLIAHITFAPALPVERITVTLTLTGSDQARVPVVITQEAA